MNLLRQGPWGLGVCLHLLAVGFCSAGVAASETPNLIVILADDLGYGDVSCYGATQIKTPNIDRFAREGLRFTDAHAPAAVCTPTRYGLLTGRYCWRSRLQRGTLGTSHPLLI